MSEGLFRKASIDKVSSPEQLDLLMRVTAPAGWIALVAVGVMLIAVGVWSVLGSIPDLVTAGGTLFRGERLYDVKATMGGHIVALSVQPDSMVVAGQTIAKLQREQESSEQVQATKEQMTAVDAQIQADKDQLAANSVNIAKYRSAIARSKDQLDQLRRQYELQKQLVDQGIKAPKDLYAIKQQMDEMQGAIESNESEIQQLQAKAVSIQADIETTQSRSLLTQAGLKSTTEVKSPESGRVVEVIKSTGDTVAEGEPLIRIERRDTGDARTEQVCGGDVHALVYVSAALAGKVKKGQFVRVSPSDVKKEEYGFVFGTVERVASYPSSTADMTEKLKNDQLVRQFMAGGPAFEVRVCLERDPNNKVNPFKWSSSQGPPKGTDAGTTCSVSIVVDEKKPYTYVIPAVRRAAGL